MIAWLLSSAAFAGACNCGADYYLAKLAGNPVAPGPDAEGHCPQGGPDLGEAISCGGPDEWPRDHADIERLNGQVRIVLGAMGQHGKDADATLLRSLFSARSFRTPDAALQKQLQAAADRGGRGTEWAAYAKGPASAVLYGACANTWTLTDYGYIRDFTTADLVPPRGATRDALACDEAHRFALQLVAQNPDDVLDSKALAGMTDKLLDQVEGVILARAGAPHDDFLVNLHAGRGANDPAPGFDPAKLTGADEKNLARVRAERKKRATGR